MDDPTRSWSQPSSPGDPAWSTSGQVVAAAQLDASAIATADRIATESVEVSAFDVETGRRLSDLAAALRTPEGRMRWSEVDLRRVFSTERIALQQARVDVGAAQLGIIRKADLIRNVLVLVPIFLTWFALAEASRAYARFIAANPDEISKPFSSSSGRIASAAKPARSPRPFPSSPSSTPSSSRSSSPSRSSPTAAARPARTRSSTAPLPMSAASTTSSARPR